VLFKVKQVKSKKQTKDWSNVWLFTWYLKYLNITRPRKETLQSKLLGWEEFCLLWFIFVLLPFFSLFYPFILFGVLNVSCTHMSVFLPRFGRFSVIVSLKKFTIILACISLWSTPKILGLFSCHKCCEGCDHFFFFLSSYLKVVTPQNLVYNPMYSFFCLIQSTVMVSIQFLFDLLRF
jgi:hypothetical protein